MNTRTYSHPSPAILVVDVIVGVLVLAAVLCLVY